jgi:hypothetical protein
MIRTIPVKGHEQIIEHMGFEGRKGIKELEQVSAGVKQESCTLSLVNDASERPLNTDRERVEFRHTQVSMREPVHEH